MSEVRDVVLYSYSGPERQPSMEISRWLATESIMDRETWVATQRSGLVRAKVVSADDYFVRVVAPDVRLCHGDSGTPLIVADGDSLRVLGVLDVGAADCAARGVNRFARVDRLSALQALLRHGGHFHEPS